MTPLDELSKLLRPAGGGIFVVSTGKQSQLELQRRLYGASTEAEIEARWKAALSRVATAKGLVLGLPSDVGAGFVRGANLGPQAIRERLLVDDPAWPAWMERNGLVDLGDVFVVPQLLRDDMLSAQQLEKTRRALYPGDVAAGLPVSPLSIAERAWQLALSLNPQAKVFALGGDHSTALPGVKALAAARGPTFAIVQPDAHTDLLEERLGVRECFATWSFHANELLGRGGKLVQVGIRASGKPRAHWESTLGVRQFWAEEILRAPEKALDEVLAAVKATKTSGVYFSNDIDGTDERFADATGTPEPGGLEPEWVLALIRRLGAEVGLVGGDVMEVAPAVHRSVDGRERTLALAARYFRATVEAALIR